MKVLAICILAFLDLKVEAGGGRTAYDCTPGDSWAVGKIKEQCFSDGVKPVACLPKSQLGNELKPGQEITDNDIRFKCTSIDEFSMSYDPIACALPNGEFLKPGQEKGIADKGFFKCIKNQDGSLTRKDDYGCFFEGKLYDPGQVWKSGSSQVVCVKGEKGFSVESSGCFLPNGDLIKVNAYAEQNTDKVKCLTKTNEKWVSVLVKVTEQEYLTWLAGVKSQKEVSGGGDIAVGQRKTTTTTTTTKKPTTTTRRTTTQPPCVDLHPTICPDLCKDCRDESVGLALRKKRMAIKPKGCPFADVSRELINNICPKSCKICGTENLKKAADLWVLASCSSKPEKAVGLAL